MGSLRGTVVDGAGKGLRGAIVSAINEDEQKSISVLTDPEGRFILDRLPPYEYELRARLVGFDDEYLDTVDVSAGDGAGNVKLVMKPAEDLLRQRTGASLFGELKFDNDGTVDEATDESRAVATTRGDGD